MKRLFLYKLLKHSRIAFVLVMIFIFCYAVTFYKKMDMLMFPYNSMYTVDFTGANIASTYAMKINGRLVKITHKPYWKKDLLETSLYGYCNYIRHNNKVLLDDYLQQKFPAEKTNRLLSAGLTPDKNKVIDWPRWYAAAAGYEIASNTSIELLQYNFRYDNNHAVITDSVSIYKNILQ